jgi:outer membrane murein-binding lipoprotein Lpp
LLRNTLPGHYLADDSKDYIRLGTGLITTLAALVLGLLVGSANSSYDAQSTQVRHLTANIVLLDRLLEQYGPETRDARDNLRRAIEPLVKRIWREDSLESTKGTPFRGTALAEDAFGKILNLSPKTDLQRAFKDRAIQVATDLVQTRLLLFEHPDSAIPMPFLAVLLFWLAIIFMSFSLFSRLTPINIVAMLVFAVSASAALFLILELGQPFVGLMQISSTPLLTALAPLGS